MLGPVAHIGITVRDMAAAIAFYVDVLGMEKLGEATFSGEEASRLTRMPGTGLRATDLRGGKEIKGPPLELLHFIEPATDAAQPSVELSNPGITEVVFWVNDIEKAYIALRPEASTSTCLRNCSNLPVIKRRRFVSGARTAQRWS